MMYLIPGQGAFEDRYTSTNDQVDQQRQVIQALVDALRAMRQNVDTSTINNSTRSVKRWTELVDQADAALSRV